MKHLLILLIALFSFSTSQAQTQPWQGKFEPIDNMIAPPNTYRTASGAPGREYWQQRADYKIKATLDEKNNMISGEETITYHNNSPDDLSYLWIQLEQNVNKKENPDFGDAFGGVRDNMSTRQMQFLTRAIDFPAGYTIKYIKDNSGNEMKALVNNTMMKVMLNEPLKSGSTMNFSMAWSYHITDRSMFLLSREGYEYFPEDDNTVYLIAHWFPRMAVYSDTEGWQNQQFQRLGEFALEFGDYEVEISVPEDHIVASTGRLQNSESVLSKKQRQRLAQAEKSFDKPIMIVTPEEATSNEKSKTTKLKTWKFHAENVRDFAFASSRKFIWDAQNHEFSDHNTMAMSFYPKEGLPVWSEESTKAVVAAFEQVTGKKIIIPPHFDVTGAIGVAILAKRSMAAGQKTRFKGFDVRNATYKLSRFICQGCTNHCEIRRVKIDGEKKSLYYGGRCEKWETDDRKKADNNIPNLFNKRTEMLMEGFVEKKAWKPACCQIIDF